MGVAVQSHWFSVGSVVSWARPGVGAVATQSIGEPSYGPDALELLADGVPAAEALARLVAADERRQFRPGAGVDAAGRAGGAPGRRGLPHAGPQTGGRHRG